MRKIVTNAAVIHGLAAREAVVALMLALLLAASLTLSVCVPVGVGVAWADEPANTEAAANTEAPANTESEGTNETSSDTGAAENKGAATDPLAALSADTKASEEDEDDGNLVKPQQLPDSSFIYDTQLIDLATADSFYDGQTVQVVGEAVGDILEEDFGSDHRWVTLYAEDADVTATLAVFMKETDTHLINKLGSYSRVGTMLQVRGTFHLACPEHAGISDLHAENVVVTNRGYQQRDKFNPASFIPGLVLVLIGIALMIGFHFMRERQR